MNDRHLRIEGAADKQEWTLVPRALHFSVMCGEILIYDGVTSEKQGHNLINSHNASIAVERNRIEATENALDIWERNYQDLLNEVRQLRK